MEGEVRTWWVIRGKEKYGPYTRSELKAMAIDGNVVGADMIWKDGLKAPVVASSINGLIPPAPAPAPEPPVPPPAAAPAAASVSSMAPAKPAPLPTGYSGGSEPHNPYRAPSATVDDPELYDGDILFGKQARQVSAGHGSQWISEAWEIFKLAPFKWMLLLIVYTICVGLPSLLPVLGPFLQTLLKPMMGAGLVSTAHAGRTEGVIEISHLFDGFNQKSGPLLLLGLLYTAMFIVAFALIAVLVLVLFGGDLAGLSNPAQFMTNLVKSFAGHSAGSIVVLVLLSLLIFLPVTASLWFAPSLVLLSNASPTEALGASFRGCLSNWSAGLVFFFSSLLIFFGTALLMGLVVGGLGTVLHLHGALLALAVIAMALLMFSFMVTLVISVYTAFSDLFGRQAA
jgi:hypothetical protein